MYKIINPDTGEILLELKTKNKRAVQIIAHRLQAIVR